MDAVQLASIIVCQHMPKLDINSFIIELASLKMRFHYFSITSIWEEGSVSEDNLQESFLLLPRGSWGIELRWSGLAASANLVFLLKS